MENVDSIEKINRSFAPGIPTHPDLEAGDPLL
jgi:hypothetical protein